LIAIGKPQRDIRKIDTILTEINKRIAVPPPESTVGFPRHSQSTTKRQPPITTSAVAPTDESVSYAALAKDWVQKKCHSKSWHCQWPDFLKDPQEQSKVIRLLTDQRTRDLKRGVFANIPYIDTILADLRRKEDPTVKGQFDLAERIEQRILATQQLQDESVTQQAHKVDSLMVNQQLTDEELHQKQATALKELRREWDEKINLLQAELDRVRQKPKISQSEASDAAAERKRDTVFHPSGKLLSMRAEARRLAAAARYEEAESWMVRGDEREIAEMKEMLFRFHRDRSMAIRNFEAKQRAAFASHKEFRKRKEESEIRKDGQKIAQTKLKLQQLSERRDSIRWKIRQTEREDAYPV
jgi:hypothetical protein